MGADRFSWGSLQQTISNYQGAGLRKAARTSGTLILESASLAILINCSLPLWSRDQFSVSYTTEGKLCYDAV